MQSNMIFRRAHRWGWPSITAVVFPCAGLLALAGFWIGAHIVPEAGDRRLVCGCLCLTIIQSVIREKPAVEITPPIEDNIELAQLKRDYQR